MITPTAKGGPHGQTKTIRTFREANCHQVRRDKQEVGSGSKGIGTQSEIETHR
jgi:hypothetical protein